MPATYSINVGQITESYRKPDIFSVLSDLPNNTQKLISPKDVRDAFLSTWANSSFKVTTGETFSSIEYIGLDSGNPEDRDIKKRILIGKRSFGNLDIMNSTLLNNSSADIFLYNTKSDSSSQESTKIAILAGTNSSLHTNAPYIEGYATASAIDLNIINPSPFGGDINIFSSTGRVAINGIVFPTAAETSASASNGKILRYVGTYPFGSLQWDDSTVTISDIGSPGSPTNIYGDPVLLNGYPLEFIDDSLVPVNVGGITAGSSFPADSFTAGGFTTPGTGQDWPLSEVLRLILYPYIEPVLSLSVTNPITGNTYAEAGTTPSLQFDWSITTYARDNNEDIRDFAISETSAPYSDAFFTGSSFSAIPGSTTGSTFNYATYSSGGPLDLTLYVSTDNITPLGLLQGGYPSFGYSFSVSETITFIYPSFSGFTPTIFSGALVPVGSTTGDIGIIVPSPFSDPSTLKTITDSITKLVEPYPGTGSSISITSGGTGYFYFIFPNSFTTEPIEIKDPNGYKIYDASSPTFSSFLSINITHPDYSIPYKVWVTKHQSTWTGTGEFEFIF